MLVSEICEYLGSELKVPTEINGFLLRTEQNRTYTLFTRGLHLKTCEVIS